jgi:hypothetical protein
MKMFIVVVMALMVGMVIGRLSKPIPAKAAGNARVVHVAAPPTGMSVTVSGYGGTASGISCIPGDAGADCYVLVQ